MSKSPYRFGGLSFIVGGALFLVEDVLDLASGPPPSSGAEILAWIASHKIPLAFISEVLFFATVCLVPAVVALYRRLAGVDRTKAALGCGIIAAVIPVLFVLLILHGRLVYPIYGMQTDTPAVAELIIATFYGGMHAVGLLIGFATVLLSVALRRAIHGNTIAYLGFVTGAFDVVGAYPDKIGPILTAVSQGLLAVWFVALGWWLATPDSSRATAC